MVGETPNSWSGWTWLWLLCLGLLGVHPHADERALACPESTHCHQEWSPSSHAEHWEACDCRHSECSLQSVALASRPLVVSLGVDFSQDLYAPESAPPLGQRAEALPLPTGPPQPASYRPSSPYHNRVGLLVYA